jgi:hypothetical protein
VRFKPGFGPGWAFRFDPLAGGARRLEAVAAGVEAALESDAFGAGEGALMRSAGVEAKGVEDAMESDGNRARRVDDRDNLMILDFGSLEENLEFMAAAAAGIVAVEADMVDVVFYGGEELMVLGGCGVRELGRVLTRSQLDGVPSVSTAEVLLGSLLDDRW